ncbi:TetR/AcrR family transcriptional regulator [Methylobacterium pseudosasicola]|uniref:Transcriptional regulator, TetR family n=1 Tax=Methylobacterium pseudosasicola TaxID=582667 RepID=A0A1I4GUZ8_9HYPH|nr:TetR/AcrR family transcriptional regulator [Methylobacterium pseudosasicola]SFL33749.1 transcriptional regulator, TetR family [Methylobacterium pseudosasicola]
MTVTAAQHPDVRQQILDTAQVIMGGKGFSAVGLNEILVASRVPKGSFYHYFKSKDAFGEALLENYFSDYLRELDATFARPGLTGAERLMLYWQTWRDTQATCDPQGKCLAVKLGAEVADLSEGMRGVLLRGTTAIIRRLASIIGVAVADGSLDRPADAHRLAETLYQLWLGASLRAKITRDAEPLEAALVATRQILNLDTPN